jgi:hypothetical protein
MMLLPRCLLLLLLLLSAAAAAAMLPCLHLALPTLGWWQENAPTTATLISVSTILLTARPA